MVKQNWFTCSGDPLCSGQPEQDLLSYYTPNIHVATYSTINQAIDANGWEHPVYRITVSVERVK